MKVHWLATGVVLAVLIGVVLILPKQRVPPAISISHKFVVTTATSRSVTSKPLTPQVVTYLDLVRQQNPLIAATQPLEVPVDLPEAAHLILHQPIYLDSAGHLWITHERGRPAEQLLAGTLDPPEHIVKDRVLFSHWAADEAGVWTPTLVIELSHARFELVTAKGRKSLPALGSSLYWERAFSWANHIVVPAEGRIVLVDLQPVVAAHEQLFKGEPWTVLDGRGLLAWVPHGDDSGGPQVFRFTDGGWSDLSRTGWLPRPLQLVPLLDGSVLEVASANAEDDTVRLAVVPLEMPRIEDQHVTALVAQLGDPDQDRRQAAFDELSRYGPGVLPKLESLADAQPPETRLRLRQLLRGKAAPALAGMELIDNRLSVVGRSIDGSTLLFASAGVRVPLASGEWDTVSPAWLCLHPDGRFDRPLMPKLVVDQDPKAATLSAYHDEWIISDTAGVRRWSGVQFVDLLSEAESRYAHLVGVDRRGRWLFRDPLSPSAGTLIVDPTLSDPTPRLPAWTMRILPTVGKANSPPPADLVGWDDHDWPAIWRGGPWTLQPDHWEELAPGDRMHDSFDAVPAPSTAPTTRPALLTSQDGTRYYNGFDALDVISRNGQAVHWSFPAAAIGAGPSPTLLRTEDGRLFLFNQGGRCLCLVPTPNGPEPFTLAAVFTKNIPNTDTPARIWMDPAGRIDIASEGNRLTVLFPAGHIPPEIENMMNN